MINYSTNVQAVISRINVDTLETYDVASFYVTDMEGVMFSPDNNQRVKKRDFVPLGIIDTFSGTGNFRYEIKFMYILIYQGTDGYTLTQVMPASSGAPMSIQEVETEVM